MNVLKTIGNYLLLIIPKCLHDQPESNGIFYSAVIPNKWASKLKQSNGNCADGTTELSMYCFVVYCTRGLWVTHPLLELFNDVGDLFFFWSFPIAVHRLSQKMDKICLSSSRLGFYSKVSDPCEPIFSRAVLSFSIETYLVNSSPLVEFIV